MHNTTHSTMYGYTDDECYNNMNSAKCNTITQYVSSITYNNIYIKVRYIKSITAHSMMNSTRRNKNVACTTTST